MRARARAVVGSVPAESGPDADRIGFRRARRAMPVRAVFHNIVM
jgi:hypothetical protein